jgi:hypothetical protein
MGKILNRLSTWGTRSIVNQFYFIADRFRMSTPVREARIAVMILVEALWEDGAGKTHSISGRMEDKSLSGACLRVKTPIDLGAKLRIQSRTEQFSGVVRYCRSEGWDYVVGIQRDKLENVPNLAKGVEPLPASAGELTKVRDVRLNVQELPASEEGAAIKVPTVNPAELAMAVANRSAVTFPGRMQGKESEVGRTMIDRGTEGRGQIYGSRERESGRLQRTGMRTAARPKAKEIPNERKPMTRKWLDLTPWQKKREDVPASVVNNGSGDGERVKENSMHQAAADLNAEENKSDDAASLRVELLPVEDIYSAAGITPPQKGYSIHKVVEMLNNEHIRGLSKEMRRAAVVMALEAAGMSFERVQQDAKARQSALESYEAEQKKQIETEWARKAEENVQIQEELERVRARYMARVTRNLDGIAREKATFESWVTLKKQEMQNIGEVVELCSKPEATAVVTTPLARAATAGADASGPAETKAESTQ